jgi:hypothetical protein
MNITRITPTKYAFKLDGFEFFAEANANSGAWILPSYTKDQFGVMRDNRARLAHGQIVQFLRQNPLMIRTNKIDGATNKRIFTLNPVFK